MGSDDNTAHPEPVEGPPVVPAKAGTSNLANNALARNVELMNERDPVETTCTGSPIRWFRDVAQYP